MIWIIREKVYIVYIIKITEISLKVLIFVGTKFCKIQVDREI